jgi:hypothetical protein
VMVALVPEHVLEQEDRVVVVNVTNSTAFGHCLEIPFEIGDLLSKKLSYRIASLSVRIA